MSTVAAGADQGRAAAGATAALSRRATEGGSWLVRVSLVQTAMWVQQLGLLDREAYTCKPGVPSTDNFDVRLKRVDSVMGEVTSAADAVRYSSMPAASPLTPLGARTRGHTRQHVRGEIHRADSPETALTTHGGCLLDRFGGGSRTFGEAHRHEQSMHKERGLTVASEDGLPKPPGRQPSIHPRSVPLVAPGWNGTADLPGSCPSAVRSSAAHL